MVRTRTNALLLSGLISITACNSGSSPEGGWVIAGPVVAREVSISIGGPPTIHVKESASDGCGIIFLVRPSTEIWRRTSSGVVRASYDDLILGKQVRVWARVVLESCPGQSAAEVVEIQP